MENLEKNIIEQCSDYGIINIKKLESIDDYKLVIKILNENPISVEEYILKLFKEEKHSELFKFAVDNDLVFIKSYYVALNNPKASVKTLDDALKLSIVRDHKYKKICIPFYSCVDMLSRNIPVSNYPDSILTIIKNFKDKYIQDLLKKHNHVEQIKEIFRKKGLKTHEFNKLLEERKFKYLAIELCSGIEAVLKEKYHLEGDLHEIMTKYTDEICKKEDTKHLLHKLRKYRNNCIHSNVDLDCEEPTYVEFKYLVNYVTNFGYGEDEYE